MPGNTFYENTSDTDLAKEIIGGCSELYIMKHSYTGLATLTLSGAGTDTLVLVDSGSAADDAYNSTMADNLYIEDDNGFLARGKVTDTFQESTGTLIEFEADNMVLVSDGATAPTLTDATSYNVRILSGSNKNLFGDYFGYTDDSVEFDSTPETEPLEVCNIEGQMEEIAEKVSKRILTLSGATYNVPNSDILKTVMSMEQYGLNNTTKSEFHGGFSPNISNYYQITALTKTFDGKYLAVQIFKQQVMNNGAWTLTGSGWKTLSFTAKGKKDELRDSVTTNGFRILIWS